MTSTAMRTASMPVSFHVPADLSCYLVLPDDRCRPAYLHDPDGRADRNDLGLVEGAGRPVPTVEANPAVVSVDRARDNGCFADEGIRVHEHPGAAGKMPLCDGPDEHQ